MLAERYHWPQTVTDAQDPRFITELVAFISAEALIQHKHRPKKKAGRNG